LEEWESRAKRFVGIGSVRRIETGRYFQLADHPEHDLDSARTFARLSKMKRGRLTPRCIIAALNGGLAVCEIGARERLPDAPVAHGRWPTRAADYGRSGLMSSPP
jgi:hypothetical protein